MTGRAVDRVPSYATTPEALGAVAEAYRRLFDRWPGQTELVILAAQSAHETNAWQAMPCFNVAGLKASLSGPHDYFEALTTEYVDQPDGPPKPVRVVQRFRAYPDLAAGAYDWLSLLHRGYPAALAGARAGDVDAFVRGLRQGWGRGAHYFTAPFDDYLTAVKRRAAEITRYPIDYTAITEAA